jgi:hypothetical protein
VYRVTRNERWFGNEGAIVVVFNDQDKVLYGFYSVHQPGMKQAWDWLRRQLP